MVDASAVGSDGVIARLYFFLDGRVVEKLTSPTDGSSYQYTFSGLAAGEHWLGVRAYDDKGLWGHQFVRATVEEAVPVLFTRGDCNDDGNFDISDAVSTLGSLFLGEGDPGCDDACDSNDDGNVDIADAVATLGVLFFGNGVIPLPGVTQCGGDPTDDVLGCDRYLACP